MAAGYPGGSSVGPLKTHVVQEIQDQGIQVGRWLRGDRQLVSWQDAGLSLTD